MGKEREIQPDAGMGTVVGSPAEHPRGLADAWARSDFTASLSAVRARWEQEEKGKQHYLGLFLLPALTELVWT